MNNFEASFIPGPLIKKRNKPLKVTIKYDFSSNFNFFSKTTSLMKQQTFEDECLLLFDLKINY